MVTKTKADTAKPYKILKYLSVIVEDELYLREYGLFEYYEELLEQISQNPETQPPPFENLVRDLEPCISRPVPEPKSKTLDRLVYKVDHNKREIMIYSAYTHYGDQHQAFLNGQSTKDRVDNDKELGGIFRVG